MRPIGFSTGALALSDFRLALEELQGQATDSIELSALRYRELRPLLHALNGVERMPRNGRWSPWLASSRCFCIG
jgi:hypothetical protein